MAHPLHADRPRAEMVVEGGRPERETAEEAFSQAQKSKRTSGDKQFTRDPWGKTSRREQNPISTAGASCIMAGEREKPSAVRIRLRRARRAVRARRRQDEYDSLIDEKARNPA